MAPKSIQGNLELAKNIKLRRNELKLTIEEAALRAGVGTKTWSRYEAGESIRKDKCKGVCKALNWHSFPSDENYKDKKSLAEEFCNHTAWSEFLEDNYGFGAAVSFAVGSDLLYDNIKQDIAELESMPSGSHLGQLGVSYLLDDLPSQFVMRYDYDFLYHMQCTLLQMRSKAKHGTPMTAHSVMEELIIYLCNEEAQSYIEICADSYIAADIEKLGDLEDWVFDMFGDMDIRTCLYSNMYLNDDHQYHFANWNEQQFYID